MGRGGKLGAPGLHPGLSRARRREARRPGWQRARPPSSALRTGLSVSRSLVCPRGLRRGFPPHYHQGSVCGESAAGVPWAGPPSPGSQAAGRLRGAGRPALRPAAGGPCFAAPGACLRWAPRSQALPRMVCGPWPGVVWTVPGPQVVQAPERPPNVSGLQGPCSGHPRRSLLSLVLKCRGQDLGHWGPVPARILGTR